jgi:hypothetical protein
VTRLTGRVLGALETAVALLLLVGIEAGLRMSTLPAVSRLLGISADLSRGGRADGLWSIPRRYERRLRAMHRATRWWPFGDTCLRRCLLVGVALRRLHPVLRIGVRRDEAGVVRAHSWLEIDGQALEAGVDVFEVLERHGGDER